MALSLVNPPCKVFFAGFESDTHRLGRAGWKVSLEDAPDREWGITRPRILLHHPGPKLNMIAMARGGFNVMEWRHRADPWGGLPEFVVEHVAADMLIRMVSWGREPLGFHDWHHTESSLVEDSEINLMRMPLFQKLAAPVAEELIVEPQTVSQLLDEIRRRQAPEQAEIRKRERARQGAAPVVHASILTFPMAA